MQRILPRIRFFAKKRLWDLFLFPLEELDGREWGLGEGVGGGEGEGRGGGGKGARQPDNKKVLSPRPLFFHACCGKEKQPIGTRGTGWAAASYWLKKRTDRA